MLSITSHQEMHIKTNELSPIPGKMAYQEEVKISGKNAEKESPCIPLMRTEIASHMEDSIRFPQNIKQLSYDLAIPCLKHTFKRIETSS